MAVDPRAIQIMKEESAYRALRPLDQVEDDRDDETFQLAGVGAIGTVIKKATENKKPPGPGGPRPDALESILGDLDKAQPMPGPPPPKTEGGLAYPAEDAAQRLGAKQKPDFAIGEAPSVGGSPPSQPSIAEGL